MSEFVTVKRRLASVAEILVKMRSVVRKEFLQHVMADQFRFGGRIVLHSIGVNGMSLLRALFIFLAASIPAVAADPRPNVLFIAVDDLRATIGAYGDPVAITPNIDRLAARGTLFKRAYCQQAVCNPSRQSLLSGRRPDSIRVWDLSTLFRTTAPDVVPLPEHFKLNGYFAQAFGKIYHGQPGMTDPESWSVPEQFERAEKRDDYRLEENRQPSASQKASATEFVDAPEDSYVDGKVASAAVAFLRGFVAGATGGRPFFLAVGIRKPHLPFTAPKKYWDLYDRVRIPPVARLLPPEGGPLLALHDSAELRGYSDMPAEGPWTQADIARLRRGYYAAASFADAQIGRVMEALEETGLAESTIVVLWGDHGFHLGEHGLWTKNSNYEADVRVPLIIATPDARPLGVRSEALVELLDIYPTLIELCGLPPRAKLEGQSLVPLLGHPEQSGREVAFSQFPRPWTYRGLPQHMGYSVRSITHRYVEWRRFGSSEVVARELYAYDGDELFERENLADRPDHAALVRELSGRLPEFVQ